MKLLITGGAGFIGANFIRHLRRVRPSWRLVNLDKLTYAGNLESLEGVDASHHTFVHGDIGDRGLVDELLAAHAVDAIVHLAAESHVDRSILDPAPFLSTNVVGTGVLLAAAQAARVSRFLHVSTDEVYGSLEAPATAHEETPFAPSSPYAASKAAADHLALAYHRTYGLPVVITRASNNYGPYQLPEKLIPLMIQHALEDRPLPVYGDGGQTRDWLHVEDHAAGLLLALEAGRPGHAYHLGAGAGHTNLDVVRAILAAVGKPDELIRFVADRPGHDRRYALACDKARAELGFRPAHGFADGLAATIAWYVANEAWWRRVLSGEHHRFYEAQYRARLASEVP